MVRNLLAQLMLCLGVLGFSIYSYLDKQNQCTRLKMRIPKLIKEVETLREYNAAFQYQIDCFEAPQSLIELSKRKEYAHLKYPVRGETLTLKEVVFRDLPVDSTSVSSPTPLIVAAKKS